MEKLDKLKGTYDSRDYKSVGLVNKILKSTGLTTYERAKWLFDNAKIVEDVDNCPFDKEIQLVEHCRGVVGIHQRHDSIKSKTIYWNINVGPRTTNYFHQKFKMPHSIESSMKTEKGKEYLKVFYNFIATGKINGSQIGRKEGYL